MDEFKGSDRIGDARLMKLLDNIFNVGAKGITGLFGDTLTAKRFPLFSTNFAYPVNSDGVIVAVVNSGAIDYNVNLLRASTGITTGSSAMIKTKRFLRYTAGRDAEAMFTAIFTQGIANTEQKIGLFDDDNGFYMGFEGEDFIVARRKEGETDEIITQASFNGDKLDGTGNSEFIYNPTMINIFRITYGYLGTAEIKFQIQVTLDNVTQWLTFHTIDRRNKFNSTSIRVPYLPLRMEVDNDTTTDNIVIQTGSIYAGVFDGALEDRAARFFSANTNGTSITGIGQRLSVFHNKATFQGIENRIEAMLVHFTAGVESNKPVTINIYKLPNQDNLSGVWADVDTNNSTFEYSLDTTLNVTGAVLMVSFALSKVGSVEEHLVDLFVNLLPDEYAGIIVDNSTGGTSDVNATFRWKEMF